MNELMNVSVSEWMKLSDSSSEIVSNALILIITGDNITIYAQDYITHTISLAHSLTHSPTLTHAHTHTAQ